MYEKIIEQIVLENKLVEFSQSYGKPYTIKYIMNTFSKEKAHDIINHLYKIKWRESENF
jgi:predicted Zn-ribbon and HTH transcriptional regulator